MNASSGKFQAVIFDFDGVLVDSMGKHVQAWIKACKEIGLEIESRNILLREGERAYDTTENLLKLAGRDYSPSAVRRLLDRKRSLYAETAPEGLVPEADELLMELKTAGFKLALATGTVHENIDLVTTQQEKALFDVIITALDVQKGKPHPEPYIKAAALLAIHPEKCLVVENAPLGIKSAKAAGMFVAALTRTLPPEKLREADWIITELIQIKDILNLNRG